MPRGGGTLATKLANAADAYVIYLKMADALGDMGIVGTCIVKRDGSDAYIDTLLMSCRALGRGVEDVFLMEVLAFLKRQGVRTVTGEYRATEKNQQVETFYARHGFDDVESHNAGGSRRFALALEGLEWRRPPYFREIASHLEPTT